MDTKLEQIAREIVGYSDGSFYMEWGESYEALNAEEQSIVADAVYDEIGNCEMCGWHFMYESMETHADGCCYCWRCYEDMIAEEELEEEQ
jgi:hypothetical protein